jgi:hypothetical protein
MPEQNEWDREKEMRASAKGFLWFISALFGHWKWWLGYITGWGLLNFAMWEGFVMPLWVIPWIAAFGVVVAAYLELRKYKRASESLPLVQAKVVDLEEKLRIAGDKNAELTHAAVLGKASLDPHEWPPLTDAQIEHWTNELRPLALKSITVVHGPSIQLIKFYRSIQAIGKALSVPVDLSPNVPTKDGEFRIMATRDDPAAAKLEELCAAYYDPVTMHYANFGIAAMGKLSLFIGERPIPALAPSPAKLRVALDPNKPFVAAHWQTGPVMFYRVDVHSQSLEPIIDCKASLIRIERNGVEKWSGAKAGLTFEPGEATDSKCRTINPEAKEILDIFIDREGAIYPATWPRTHWVYDQALHTIFEDTGDYKLTIVIEAKNIRAAHFLYKFSKVGRLIEKISIEPFTPPSSTPDKNTQ